MSKTSLFVFLICFWTLTLIISNIIDLRLSITTPEDFYSSTELGNTPNGFYDILDNIPIVKYFVPMMKIMTFSYSSEIPAMLSIFLLATGIFSIYVIVATFIGG